ncbi:MAG: AAA family ATPase [Moorella sp. (in: firmicutes)]
MELVAVLVFYLVEDLFHQIQQAVQVLFRDKKITPVFILDKMHLASPKFLLDLALLFNFAMDASNHFILVLAGLPFLLSRLELNQTQSLAQRLRGALPGGTFKPRGSGRLPGTPLIPGWGYQAFV